MTQSHNTDGDNNLRHVQFSMAYAKFLQCAKYSQCLCLLFYMRNPGYDNVQANYVIK